jgi:hypothetical protein
MFSPFVYATIVNLIWVNVGQDLTNAVENRYEGADPKHYTTPSTILLPPFVYVRRFGQQS